MLGIEFWIGWIVKYSKICLYIVPRGHVFENGGKDSNCCYFLNDLEISKSTSTVCPATNHAALSVILYWVMRSRYGEFVECSGIIFPSDRHNLSLFSESIILRISNTNRAFRWPWTDHVSWNSILDRFQDFLKPTTHTNYCVIRINGITRKDIAEKWKGGPFIKLNACDSWE